MNLGVFNRVNWKESEHGGMYSEWASLSNVVTTGAGVDSTSVLLKFPTSAGRDVAVSVVRQLASNLGITQAAEPSSLTTDKEVLWSMEVICYGLSLPLSEHDTIRDCVNVYCEWLTSLYPNPRMSVPKPVCEDPNLYARKMISHFHNLFVPRKGEAPDTVNRQAVLCHRVLRTLQQLAHQSVLMDRETWETLLLFLLAINDTLLAPPTVKGDIGDQLCERVLSVLVEVWLLACTHHFPSPPALEDPAGAVHVNLALTHLLSPVTDDVGDQLCERVLSVLVEVWLLACTHHFPSPPALEDPAGAVHVNLALTHLSPVTDDVGDQLCERVLSVLVEVWLLACTHHFPSPPLWKTLRELSMNWRHRVALVEQWNRVNLALTHRLLESMYGPAFPELKILEEDAVLIPPGMTDSCVAQCWFRFLHSIGNPVDLCRPQVISQTHKFLQFALTSDTVVDPCQHPCLNVLPLNFLKAIKGIAGQVDAFLGTQSQSLVWDLGELNERDKKDPLPPTHSPTPPPARRLAKSFSVTPSAVTKGLPKASLIGLTSSRIQTSTHTPLSSGPSSTSSATSMLSLGSEVRSSLAPSRPKCNSILHLFGEWLFEAAQIGTELTKTGLKEGGSKRPSSVMLDHGSLGSNRKTSLSLSQPGSLSEESLDTPSCLNIDRYQAGRAEAIGALCRIFCAKKTGEDILPVYYARFYLTLQQCFRQAETDVQVTRECDECLACIIVNATDLLRLDLDGVQMLVPSIIDALEIILPDKDLKLKSPSISKVELRRASIQLLLSMLALPLHFQNLTIKELTPSQSQDKVPVTFAQLKPRLMNLLINALQVEADPQNTQMLLGGLMLSVLDSALYEERDQVSQPDAVSTDSTSNLLSSDTVSGSSVVDEWDSTNITVGDTELFGITSIHPLNKNSAHALLVRATYLVCHRLISSWKTDLNVSLAALELLAGLARTNIRETDALECKRAVKWLCDYIVYQCWRPPPAHSKDLHSTIVAAFQTAEVWLVTRPSLLDDKETLHTVLEVIELGISGTKSQGKPGEPLKMKDEKELKPVSMRVRDAAESLLTIVLEQVGYFPAACGPESLSCLLDEVLLVKHCNSWRGEPLTLSAAVTKFRYFVVENSTVLALLEEPLGNDQDPQPTITVLIRGGFGRHAWSLQLRHLPRHRSGTKYQHAPNPGRPVPLEEPPPRSHPRHKYFPDSVDRIPQCRADKSIPDLDALLLEDTSGELSELSHLVEAQMRLERGERAPDTPGHGPPLGECAPPPPCQEFQTARLFLSHFGLLSRLDNNQEPGLPPLVALDTSHPSFCQDLEALDNIGSRTTNTCHVFYVRTGQKSADQILNNVLSESTVSPPFLEMLLSLGWVVKVSHHPGWTGHIATSYKLSHNTTEGSAAEETPGGHGGSIFNGDSHVLYWADVSSEIAFVVPTLARRSKHLDQSQQYPAAGWYERSVSEPGDKLRAMSLDSEPSGHRSHVRRHPPTCVMLVWLESFEDHLHFPASDLQAYTATGLESQSGPKSQDCFIIFLHALNSGLLRVKLQGPTGRMSMATPLVDGMVISRRVAGTLVRQTALNICRRRRLDNDSYQPPHVRRRMKVQELVTRYRCEMSQSELLTYLLSGAP